VRAVSGGLSTLAVITVDLFGVSKAVTAPPSTTFLGVTNSMSDPSRSRRQLLINGRRVRIFDLLDAGLLNVGQVLVYERRRGEEPHEAVVMVFSTCSAKLCHRCQRSATWMASGAPVRPASA
jgi:hypothetical protein